MIDADRADRARVLAAQLLRAATNPEPRLCFSEKVDLLLTGVGTLLLLMVQEK